MKKHLLSIDDLDADDIATLFTTAAEMHDLQHRQVKKLPALRGRTIINLFFEDSTRTRSSFEIAGKWLSADTINITGKGSSASKGESLRDTVHDHRRDGSRCGGDAHAASGAAQQVSSGSTRPSSTPGTGPTSTPRRRCSTPTRCSAASARCEDRHVVIVGDLTHSRVFRSNVLCLTKLGAAGHRGRATDADAERGGRLVARRRFRHGVRPRRGAAQGRRGDDAARAA